MKKLFYSLPLLIIIFAFYVEYAEKKSASDVVVVSKLYIPAWNGAGEQSTDEQYNLYVKRVNGSTFFFGNKIRIITTNSDSYYKLKAGDILKNKY